MLFRGTASEKDMGTPQFDDIPQNINRLIAEHIQLYLTDPVQAHLWDATPMGLPGRVPTLLLTTIGRKSGEQRHVPLLYVQDEDGYLVVGSKGGNAEHPVWYLNLLARPECEIRVAALRTHARGRTLTGDERGLAWTKVVAEHPVYLKYQARTTRQIPLVRLESTAGV